MDLDQIRPLLIMAAAVAGGIAPLDGAAAQQRGATSIPPLADSTLSRITEEVTVPAGFDLSIFAGPPHLTYPTCLHPTEEAVFVCTDPNLLFGRELHRGRILRFIDDDGDGVAERYTEFADSLNAVRGILVDDETVYVMHAPTLAAYRDTTGDGVSDERRVLVSGLGFGLDDRNGDHSSNGLRMGLDGWIYAAIGDYGFVAAQGTDGTRIGLHRGGVVRVRPDGSGLEIVARGTRNIYDIALDPQLRIFARDNNNNGQGWNSVFHYLPPGADAGYPSRFRNFSQEIHPPLADFGAGAATTTLWVDEPGFPQGVSSGLLSADWALNRVYRHDLTPIGGTFRIEQQELMTIPRPVDMEVDPAGNLFIASLSGGSYDYAGENVGYIVRLRPIGNIRETPLEMLSTVDLVAELLGPSGARRLAAQRELLARSDAESATSRLEAAILDTERSNEGRTAALFTLKQIQGAASHPVLLRAASDPALRAMALRALADRPDEDEHIPTALFVEALNDPDPFVRLHAVRGLARLSRDEGIPHLMRAAADDDPTVAHVARNELGRFGTRAVDVALAALDSGGEAGQTAALQVLSAIHSPEVVSSLAVRLGRTADPQRRGGILAALARLHHQEGDWDGEWWGNQPNTEGPYFDPVRWEESPRISELLAAAIENAGVQERAALLAMLEREGLLPRESGPLLTLLDGADPGNRQRLIDQLIGDRELTPAAISLLRSAAWGDVETRAMAARMITALPAPSSAAVALLGEVATDRSLDVVLRARALTALTRGVAPGAARPATVAAYTAVVPELPGEPALLQPWRRYAGARERADEIDRFIAMAREGDPHERVLGYAVLAQVTALSRNPEAVRARAASVIESAWSETEGRDALIRAIGILGVEDRYSEELAGVRPN